MPLRTNPVQPSAPYRNHKISKKVRTIRSVAIAALRLMLSRSVVAVKTLNTVDKTVRRSTGRNTN